MLPHGVIYKITNTKTGKSYIGQTVNSPKKRWALHVQAAKFNFTEADAKSAIHASIRKHGPENFVIDLVCTCFDEDSLNAAEIECIRTHQTLVPNGYNLKEGGSAGKWSLEAREKISEARKILFQTNEEWRSKFIKTMANWIDTLTDDQYKEYVAKQSRISKGAWNDERKIRHKETLQQAWKSLPEEEKARRTAGNFGGRNEVEYWAKEKHRKEQSELVKNSEAYKASNHTAKMKAVCANPIVAINMATLEETVYESKTACIKALKISYKTLEMLIATKKEHHGCKLKRMQNSSVKV